MKYRHRGGLFRTVPAVVCLLVALIGFGTPAAGRSSKDLRLAHLDFSARQDIVTVDPSLGHGNGGNGGGPPQQITTDGEVLQLRWSPAGNLFAIMSPENTIVVLKPDGSDPRIVATDDASLGEFSPDGDRLALVRYADGRNDIWVVDLVGGGVSPVVTFAIEGFTSHLVWSSDGTQLAFDRSDCPGGTGCGDPQVIVVDADGTAQHTVAIGTDPSWSPDNKQLAFSGPLGEVRIVSAAGGPARTIATRTLGAPTVLAWQPKGNLIAFFTGDQNPLEDTFSIATVRRDGKKLDSLPLPGFSTIDLAWSPNGKNLASARSTRHRTGSGPTCSVSTRTSTHCGTSPTPAPRSDRSGRRRHPPVAEAYPFEARVTRAAPSPRPSRTPTEHSARAMSSNDSQCQMRDNDASPRRQPPAVRRDRTRMSFGCQLVSEAGDEPQLALALPFAATYGPPLKATGGVVVWSAGGLGAGRSDRPHRHRGCRWERSAR